MTYRETRGVQGFLDDLARQRDEVRGLCPPYDRLLDEALALLGAPAGAAGRAILERLEVAWRVRLFVSFYDRPLLLLGSLRHDAVAEGPAHPLWKAIAAEPPDLAAVSRDALVAALGPERARVWNALAGRSVQTNDAFRAVAWRWPARLAGCDGGARPVALIDVGASAGLNLVADRLPAPWTVPGGAPLPVASNVRAVLRLGLDMAPLDVGRAEDLAWLRALVWPGDPERRGAFEAAVEAVARARAEGQGPALERVEAIGMPMRIARAARALAPGTLLLVYQSIFIDYLRASEREEYRRAMRSGVALAARGDAVWIELEGAGDADRTRPAAIRAHFRGAGMEVRSVVLARCGWHPTEIAVDEAAADALRAALAPRG